MIIKNIKLLIVLIWCVCSLNIAIAQSSKQRLNTDNRITAAVSQALKDNDLSDDLGIKISTRKGVVKLSGVVDNQEQIDRAIEAANSVEGIKSLDTTNLTIPPTQKARDARMTAKIRSLLMRNGVSAGVRVKTVNNIVYLSGTLTQKQSRKVGGLIGQIEGISDVIDTTNIIDPNFDTRPGGY